MKLYMQNIAEGIFLTSGVCGDADVTTQQMLQAVHLLREKYKFQGYIHFKCLPGTSYSLLKDAVTIADRISVNVEAPTKEILSDIAEQKNYDTDILTRQRWLKEIRLHHNHGVSKILAEQGYELPEACIPNKNPDSINSTEWIDEEGLTRRQNGYLRNNWDNAPIMNSGQTTQFIVGAGGESDYSILKRLDWEYKEIDLRRGYFSALSPIQVNPLERSRATPLDREHRLYQTDWLLRRYHFPLKEVHEILDDNNNLPMGDPKLHMAKVYFEDNGRLDINQANYDQLLRVPGIGPMSAQRIMRMRKSHELIQSRKQLHTIGVVLKRAEPFIKINGSMQNTLDSFFKSI